MQACSGGPAGGALGPAPDCSSDAAAAAAAAAAADGSRACQLCGQPASLDCPGCAAFSYCGERHRRAHWRQLGHADECGRVAAQVARRQELAGHPFPWAAAAHALPPCDRLRQLGLHSPPAAAGTTAQTAPSTQQQPQLVPPPPTAWLRECPCGGPEAAAWGAAAPLLPQLWAGGQRAVELSRAELLGRLGDAWLGLPPEQAPCLLSQAPARLPAGAGWASYYRLRGLQLASPAALLLDAALTLHEAAAQLQQLSPVAAQQGQQQQQPPLVLHLLGPQRELDQWPLLLELGCLLPPQQHVQLHLIGPEVPAAWHGCSLRVGGPAAAACGAPGCSCVRQDAAAGEGWQQEQHQGKQQQPGSMELHFWRGEWHAVSAELQQRHGRPHAVVAPNAGLAAYPSWVPTLQRLLSDMRGQAGGGGRRPLVCCFTDFNEEAAFRGQQLLGHLLREGQPSAAGVDAPAAPGSLGVTTCMHPFRQPAAVLSTDHALPSASNGFALWLTAAERV